MGEQAGLNWNDGFMGGDLVEGNVIFNMVRETGGKVAAGAYCLFRVAVVALSPSGCLQIMVRETTGCTAVLVSLFFTRFELNSNPSNGTWDTPATTSHCVGLMCTLPLIARIHVPLLNLMFNWKVLLIHGIEGNGFLTVRSLGAG